MDENLEQALAEIFANLIGAPLGTVLYDIHGMLSTADNGYPLEW